MAPPNFPKRRRVEDRVLFAMPAHLRVAQMVTRSQNASASGHRRPGHFFIEDEWDQGSMQRGTYTALETLVAEAECLSEVRGDEYVERRLSAFLSELEVLSAEGDGDPDGYDNAWLHFPYCQKIADELAGR